MPQFYLHTSFNTTHASCGHNATKFVTNFLPSPILPSKKLYDRRVNLVIVNSGFALAAAIAKAANINSKCKQSCRSRYESGRGEKKSHSKITYVRALSQIERASTYEYYHYARS